MPDSGTMIVIRESHDRATAWLDIQAAIADGRTVSITRHALADGVIDAARLRADPAWEMDPITGDMIRYPGWLHKARAEAEEALIEQRKAAEIALARVMIELEPWLPIQGDSVLGIAPDNTRYKVVADEVLAEGQHWRGHRTSAEAIAAWRRNFTAHLSEAKGDTLWWRIRPEIDAQLSPGECEPRWRVYSRFAVGNQADTTLGRIAAGKLWPVREMVHDNLVTDEQLSALGWCYSEATGTYRRAVYVSDGSRDTGWYTAVYQWEHGGVEQGQTIYESHGPYISEDAALAAADRLSIGRAS